MKSKEKKLKESNRKTKMETKNIKIPLKFMNFFQPNKKLIEDLTDKYKKSIETQELLAAKIGDLEADTSRYKGNAYTSYGPAVAAIEKKYSAKADWGVVLTGNIIDLRAAFIIGNGLKIRPAVSKKDAQNELEWAADFMAYNKLDRELIVELAKEAEIEGKIAIKLAVEDAKGWRDYEKMVSMRFVSWADIKYIIKSAADDYMNYEKLIWKASTKTIGGESVSIDAGSLEAPYFVYNKFGGRLYDPNDAQPKIMKCLTQIDDIDKALRDWREINNLFAAPVPDAECEDEEAATQVANRVKDFNFKIKKMLIHAKSTFSFKGPDMAGVDSLEKEIIMKIKIVSGTTGMPVHFLGMLDLLKNRSTGENTREMVVAGTSKERIIWIGTYAEVIEKGMLLMNEANKKKSGTLDPEKIVVDIPIYTAEQWEHIEKVFLPMNLGGKLSLEYLLSQVPNLDVEEEMERQEEKDETDGERLKAENQALKDEAAMAKIAAGEEEE